MNWPCSPGKPFFLFMDKLSRLWPKQADQFVSVRTSQPIVFIFHARRQKKRSFSKLYLRSNMGRGSSLNRLHQFPSKAFSLHHKLALQPAESPTSHLAAPLPPPPPLLLVRLNVSKPSDGNNQATAAVLNDEGELGPVSATKKEQKTKQFMTLLLLET